MLSFLKKKPAIEEFWGWFKANHQRLRVSGLNDDSAYKQLRDQLRRINRLLTFELVHGEPNELQISADGRPELIELVRDITGHAPAIAGWKIVAFRQPRAAPVEIDVFNQVLNAQNVKFKVDHSGEEGTDITVLIPGLTDENYRHLAHCAMMILESVVGEYALMTSIREIEYEDLPLDDESSGQAITELPMAINREAPQQ